MAKRKHTVLYIRDANLALPYDDQRKGRSSPLQFLKFRCPADSSPEGQIYRMRRESLKIAADGFTVLAIFDELLLEYMGNKIAPLRGFLVNHRLEAATNAELAQSIGCRSARTMMAAVRRLVAVGLLVEVERPDFEAAIRADKTIEVSPREACPKRDRIRTDKLDDPKGRADDPAAAGEAGADDPAASAGEATDPGESGRDRRRALPADSMAAGTPPEGFRKVPDPGGGTLDVRRSDGRRDTPPASTAAAAPSPSSPSADGYGRPQTEDTATAPAAPSPLPADTPTGDTPAADGQTSGTPTADSGTADAATTDAGTGQPEAGDAIAAAPALHPPKAEPMEPTEADPSRSLAGGQGRRVVADMTWHAPDFAEQVLHTLYPTREDFVVQGRRCKNGPQSPDEFEARERGCLLRAFEVGLVGVGQVDAVGLLTRSLQEASRSHKVRCKYTRGQYWRWWFGQYTAAMRRERGGRSGPP